jgi:hypothetical protein
LTLFFILFIINKDDVTLDDRGLSYEDHSENTHRFPK